MTITLPVRREIYPKDNCKTCKIKLNLENRYIHEGRINRKCKKCLSLESREYYAKRKKAAEGSRWFYQLF